MAVLEQILPELAKDELSLLDEQLRQGRQEGGKGGENTNKRAD